MLDLRYVSSKEKKNKLVLSYGLSPQFTYSKFKKKALNLSEKKVIFQLEGDWFREWNLAVERKLR